MYMYRVWNMYMYSVCNMYMYMYSVVYATCTCTVCTCDLRHWNEERQQVHSKLAHGINIIIAHGINIIIFIK